MSIPAGKSLSHLLVAFSLLTGAIHTGCAQLLLYEGFDDAANVNGSALSAVGAGTSSGFATPWATTTITTNNAGYTAGAGTGQAWSDVNLGAASNLQLSTTAGSSLGTATNHSRYLRTLDATAAAGVNTQSSANGTVWLSFMGQRNGTNLGGVELVNTTSSRYLEGIGGFSTNNWNWSDRVTAGTGEVFPVASTNEAFVTVQLVYGATSTTIRMFVNQTGNVSALTGVPSIENVIQNTSNNRPNFNAISVYGGFKIDEMRVGTTYADVAPVNSVTATDAGASTWTGTTLTTMGGPLTVSGLNDVVFNGTAAVVDVDVAGVTTGSGRLEFRSGGHVISGGPLTVANVANIAGTSTILSDVTARFASSDTGGTLELASGSLANGLYGAGNITKTGSGVLTLNRSILLNNDVDTVTAPQITAGRTTFSGTLGISNGAVLINDVRALTGAAPIVLGDAGTVGEARISIGNRIDISNPITVTGLGSGTAIIEGANTGSGANAASYLGSITLNGPVTLRGLVSADRMAIDGTVSGSGNITVDGGSRTTLLSTANNWVGDILVTGTGTVLQASVATAGEVIPNATNITVDAGAVFQLASTSGSETINALNGSGTVRTFISGSFGSILAVGAADGNGLFTGVIQNGTAGNPLSLTKLGLGTQTLGGLNTYTGNTTVDGGSLVLDTSGQLTFAPTLNGVSNKVTGAGSATFSGQFLINLSGANLTIGNSWTLVDVATRTFAGTFSVSGFNDADNDGIWTRVVGANFWMFSESTGILSLGVPYDSWAALEGLDGSPGNENGFDDDPEKDGIKNGLEWILGGDPLANSQSVLPLVSVDATNLSLAFARADEAESTSTLLLQWGTDLQGWSDVTIGAADAGPDANGIVVDVEENGDAPDSIVVSIPRAVTAGGELFARLKATKP